MEKINEEITISREEYNIKEFAWQFCAWGYRDIDAALNAWKEAGLTQDELVEAITEWMDSTGTTDTTKLDVCYIAYDAILQKARNTIEEATKFDIMNDAGFDTVGNYMCSSYDYRGEDKEKLLEAIKKLTQQELEELLHYFHVHFFLDSVDLLDDVVKLVEVK